MVEGHGMVEGPGMVEEHGMVEELEKVEEQLGKEEEDELGAASAGTVDEQALVRLGLQRWSSEDLYRGREKDLGAAGQAITELT